MINLKFKDVLSLLSVMLLLSLHISENTETKEDRFLFSVLTVLMFLFIYYLPDVIKRWF